MLKLKKCVYKHIVNTFIYIRKTLMATSLMSGEITAWFKYINSLETNEYLISLEQIKRIESFWNFTKPTEKIIYRKFIYIFLKKNFTKQTQRNIYRKNIFAPKRNVRPTTNRKDYILENIFFIEEIVTTMTQTWIWFYTITNMARGFNELCLLINKTQSKYLCQLSFLTKFNQIHYHFKSFDKMIIRHLVFLSYKNLIIEYKHFLTAHHFHFDLIVIDFRKKIRHDFRDSNTIQHKAGDMYKKSSYTNFKVVA